MLARNLCYLAPFNMGLALFSLQKSHFLDMNWWSWSPDVTWTVLISLLVSLLQISEPLAIIRDFSSSFKVSTRLHIVAYPSHKTRRSEHILRDCSWRCTSTHQTKSILTLRRQNVFRNTECGAMLLSIGGKEGHAAVLRPLEWVAYRFYPVESLTP